MNLAPVLHIVQKITENYCPWLYLSTGLVWWHHELQFKRFIQKRTLSRVLIPIATSLIWWIMEWLKIQKPEYLENGNIIFLQNKKILNLYFRWHILRSYRLGAEETFNNFLFDRWDLSHFFVSSENPINLIFFIKISWFIVSKAFCKSKSYQHKDQIQNMQLFYCLNKTDMNQWEKIS